MAVHEDKATRYIAALDTARINGDWDQLPELIRKVNKHASKQTTLVKTAAAEHAVATGKFSLTDTQGPLQALESLLPTVSNPSSEDSFQARSCLTWARALGDAPLPNDTQTSVSLIADFDQYGQNATSAWTKICLVRTAYLTSTKTAQVDKVGARNAFAAASVWIEQNRSLVESLPQLAYWSQQVLAQNALLAEDTAAGTETIAKAFHLWSNLTGRRGQDISNRRYANTLEHLTRSQVWRRYYAFASQALQSGQLEDSNLSRAQQANELRLVESAYESDLLATKKFPQATEGNTEVEQWVESVIRNWGILCGPQFSESDLGQGGRNALSRNVLDILYRAASKTFHSTLILRRLFQVHKALAEFNLAYKCLDTYLELSERGRTRSAKSQTPDPSQDSDEIIMLTIAEGIEGLCAFGWQAQAQKAYDLAIKLETWIDQAFEGSNIAVSIALTVNGTAVSDEPDRPIRVERPSDDALQSVNRAIGIGKAHWARWTPFGESRTELQAEALEALKSACLTSHPHPSSLYAYALLLAETRDIPQAIKWTKVALQDTSSMDSAAIPTKTTFWHLLALLLSSKQDFETSVQSCAAAAQHMSRSGLFQKTQNHSSSVGSTEKGSQEVAVAAQDLECVELQRIVELQLSHLALTELLEGPEAALNNSNELFSLYSTLFSRFNVDDLQVQSPASKTLDVPKSSTGPARSIRGSLFSRKRDPPSPVNRSGGSVKRETLRKPPPASRPVTQASQAPTIQVTDENEKTHRHHLFHHTHANSTRTNEEADHPTTNGHTDNVVSDGGAKQPLEEIPHQLDEPKNVPPPLKYDEQPPLQDNRLPHVSSRTTSTTPISRFSKVIAERHALTVLAKVWLVIATLYRRAHMFEDAKESCEEAAKIASTVEAHVTAQDASAKALANCGWGGTGKSADDVWADVHCEKAELTLAIAARHEAEGKTLPSELLREATAEFEQCLMYAPDHANGIVGLSGLLLDYYERKVELGKKVDDGRPAAAVAPAVAAPLTETRPTIVRSFTELSQHSHKDESGAENSSEAEDLRKTPDNLNRIAARDRAYGLLSSLTKLGSDWDNSEAWFALARAHELGGEVEKAQNILWWCIELENTRPIRHWRNLSCTGYVL